MDALLRLAADPDAWAALATLIAMEVVLGLDNLVFIALLSNRIAERRRGLARKLGLSLALVFRLALLASASWVVHFTEPLITAPGHSFSVRDLVRLHFVVIICGNQVFGRYDFRITDGGRYSRIGLSLLRRRLIQRLNYIGIVR